MIYNLHINNATKESIVKKTTLYRVKAEWLYGDGKDEKRAKQLQTLADLGLQEFEKGSVLCTADQFIQLFQAGYCGTYIRPDEAVTVAASVDAGPDVEGLFRILADKIAIMPSASMNERCGQHQPNDALLAIAETQLMECACTDALQTELAAGWRILAIQPQPDQRRPDIILGRPLMRAVR